MIQKTVAVIGGGISSLSFTMMLAKKINFKENILQVNIFQRKQILGGRIIAQQCPQDIEHKYIFCADVGANYIDYESQQERKYIESSIPHTLMGNFKKFEGKFMIYEDGKLQDPHADRQKDRYFYERGFVKMPQDFRNAIQKQKTLNFNIRRKQVEKVTRQNGKWKLHFSGEKQASQLYDILIFGTPAPQSKSILEKSNIEGLKSLRDELGKVQYTNQLSAVFEVEEKQSHISEKPYSILLFDNALKFICFHSQKYPSSKKNIAVIQMNQEFTQKWRKKLSPQNKQARTCHDQILKQIGEQINSLIPQQIKSKFNLSKQCLQVYYWPQSQVKVQPIKDKNQLFQRYNTELNKQFKDQDGHTSLYFTGDYINNKSRVTGAMLVGIKLARKVISEHFQLIDKYKI